MTGPVPTIGATRSPMSLFPMLRQSNRPSRTRMYPVADKNPSTSGSLVRPMTNKRSTKPATALVVRSARCKTPPNPKPYHTIRMIRRFQEQKGHQPGFTPSSGLQVQEAEQGPVEIPRQANAGSAPFRREHQQLPLKARESRRSHSG